MPCSMREVWLRVYVWSMEVNAVSTGDVFGKQASKSPYDAGLDKQCTL
jgi:hypothetical protein